MGRTGTCWLPALPGCEPGQEPGLAHGACAQRSLVPRGRSIWQGWGKKEEEEDGRPSSWH